MKQWLTCPLGSVLEISKEKIEPAAHPGKSFNYVGLEHIEGHTGKVLPRSSTNGNDLKSTKHIFHKDEILYGKLRPYLNKVHLADRQGICSTDILVLKPKAASAVPAFVAYFLRSPIVRTQVEGMTQGANLPRLSPRALLGLTMPTPPIPEQKRIVAILDAAEEMRYLREQADRRTGDLIPTLFHEMFGDPATNPKGWPRIRLIGLCRSADDIKCGPFGAQLHKDEFTTEGVPLWGIKNVNALFKLHTHEFLETKTAKRLQQYSIEPWDIVMTRKGTVGNCAVYPRTYPVGIMHSDLLRLRVDRERCDPIFLAHQLHHSRDVERQLAHISGGAVMPGINVTKLKTLEVLVPPFSLQRDFAARVAGIRAMETNQDASRLRLDDLFLSLLHRAFKGEL